MYLVYRGKYIPNPACCSCLVPGQSWRWRRGWRWRPASRGTRSWRCLPLVGNPWLREWGGGGGGEEEGELCNNAHRQPTFLVKTKSILNLIRRLGILDNTPITSLNKCVLFTGKHRFYRPFKLSATHNKSWGHVSANTCMFYTPGFTLRHQA